MSLRTQISIYTYEFALEQSINGSDGFLECVSNQGGRTFLIDSKGMESRNFISPITVVAITEQEKRSILNPERAFLQLEYEAGVFQSVTLVMKRCLCRSRSSLERINGVKLSFPHYK